jgi:hypothetical protein
MERTMFDLDHLLQLGAFNQLIPIWQVFFFIASMLPFLLWNRVKVCLLITYMFTYYLGFMIQWGDYLSSTGSMQPFVLYAFSGVLIAVFFVATIFNDKPDQPKPGWVRFRNPGERRESLHRDPVEDAVNVTQLGNRDTR